jgi:hypothetical protein
MFNDIITVAEVLEISTLDARILAKLAELFISEDFFE